MLQQTLYATHCAHIYFACYHLNFHNQKGAANQMAQIPTAISLLSALSGPLNPLQDMIASGGDVQGWSIYCLLFLHVCLYGREFDVCTKGIHAVRFILVF